MGEEERRRESVRPAHRSGTMRGPPFGGGLRGELTGSARGGTAEGGGAGAAGAEMVGVSGAEGACILALYIRTRQNIPEAIGQAIRQTRHNLNRDETRK